MAYIHRSIENKLKRYVREFQAVALTGSRQSGKSTLLKFIFNSGKWQFLNFDERSLLEKALKDPDFFVKNLDPCVIIDEAQKAPEIFHSIKGRIDKDRKFRVILSGSANFQLMHRVTETLAGRIGILELYPFASHELLSRRALLDLLVKSRSVSDLTRLLRMEKRVCTPWSGFLKTIYWGGYPKLQDVKGDASKKDWLENYKTTYLERDLRQLTQVADLGDFQGFYQMLAFQSSGILNLSHLAAEIGLSVPTCKKYLQILDISYQYFLLRPFHIQLRKRLVKLPKVYCVDTGMENYLLGHSSPAQMNLSGKLGGVVENWVIAEFVKQCSVLDRKPSLFFWRTSNGAEVDLVLETSSSFIPIEIKSGLRIDNQNIRGLTEFMKLKHHKKVPFGVVFYGGSEVYTLPNGLAAIPLGYL